MGCVHCDVKDCYYCSKNGFCCLEDIQIVKSIKNENSMYNTICQSYEEAE